MSRRTGRDARDLNDGEISMRMRALAIAIIGAATAAAVLHAETIDPAQVIAQKFSDASVEKPSEPKRTYEKPGADYEADMLERALAEKVERQNRNAEPLVAKSTNVAAPALAKSPSEQPAPPPPKLAALPPKFIEERPKALADAQRPNEIPATILLVIDPYGVGVHFKPDPIICIENRCWLSNGIGSPALAMPRDKAVALPTTDDATQDSCSGKSGCVYRNVSIDADQRIEVIEVGEGGGASAGAYTVAIDKTCRKQGEALACDNGLATQNFRIWIVPEVTAHAAGESSLEEAVADGLPEPDIASANDK